MAALTRALDLAVQLAFVALALLTLADWIRHRDRLRAWLVVALVSLSGLSILAPVTAAISLNAQLSTDATLILFILSGYALLMFRDSLIPLRRWLRWAITGAILVVLVLGMAADLSSNPNGPRTPFQVVVITMIL